MIKDEIADVRPAHEIAQEASTPAIDRTRKKTLNSGLLTALIGGGRRDFADIESIDAFIRAERQTWSS